MLTKTSEMFVKIPEDGYHFNKDQIRTIEELKDAKYMGYWCTQRLNGESWNERPVDVFYQSNPNVDLGHKSYFGMFVQDGIIYICDATSAFSDPITGVLCDDGEVLVSRYRHDYVTKEGYMVDGGRDYLRCSMSPLATVTVVNGEFVIEANVVE